MHWATRTVACHSSVFWRARISSPKSCPNNACVGDYKELSVTLFCSMYSYFSVHISDLYSQNNLTLSKPQLYSTPGRTLLQGLYRKAPPERRTFFFKLQVYERVGISLVEVYIRVGKSVIWVCERAQKG